MKLYQDCSDIDESIIKKANKALYRGRHGLFRRCVDSLSQRAFDDRELAEIDNTFSAKPVFKIKKLS